MKRVIQKPYKINYILYLGIIIVSLAVLFCMLKFTDLLPDLVADVITNLSYGCIASTIVALLIEIENIKTKNEKAYELYDLAFSDLKFSIYRYVQFWSRACALIDRKNDYSHETHSWMEWYNRTKNNISVLQGEKKKEHIAFVKSNVRENADLIISSINRIESQRFVLKINDVYNTKLTKLLRDLSIEFGTGMFFIKNDVDSGLFWDQLDAVNKDMEKYINEWDDIKHLNNASFGVEDLFNSMVLFNLNDNNVH